MLDHKSAEVQSPGSDVSPRTLPMSTKSTDYFDMDEKQKDDSDRNKTPKGVVGAPRVVISESDGRDLKGKRKATVKDLEVEDASDASATDVGETGLSAPSSAAPSRKPSLSSVTFRNPRNPALPQGLKKPHGGSRIREASPPHHKFEKHVTFDNIPLGESTEHNPISFTLNYRHDAYKYNQKHRTFMVGVDDNAYSDHALQWLLNELVEDGDEIVCVRVLETDKRIANKQAYQQEANALMMSIQAKNQQDRAVSLVLEYAAGKLHSTFQHLIKIHQASMLIVGTKGRNLDGVQGFLANRNSFSKWCLQYSPVPVVVVRPTEKREKKKAKRSKDPSRHCYSQILGGQKHEADSANTMRYELEPLLTADQEAHKVASALGLPAKFDPTIKPIDPKELLMLSRRRRQSHGEVAKDSIYQAATGRVPVDGKASADSEGEEESEAEDEFEVASGEQLIKKQQLHKMEMSEGAALREMQRKLSADSIEEEEEEEEEHSAAERGGRNGGKSGNA